MDSQADTSGGVAWPKLDFFRRDSSLLPVEAIHWPPTLSPPRSSVKIGRIRQRVRPLFFRVVDSLLW